MAEKKLKNLTDVGEASQLVNDFKYVKKQYFDLKRKQRNLLEENRETVEDAHWEDATFEEECETFEARKKLHAEAQDLYRALKSKLE